MGPGSAPTCLPTPRRTSTSFRYRAVMSGIAHGAGPPRQQVMRCGDAGDDGQVWVGEGGLFSPKLARRGHGEQKKKGFKEGPSRQDTPKTHPSSLVISALFFGCHTPSHLGIRDHSC